MNSTEDFSLQIIENVISRTMHDIIGPLTAVMNSVSILSSREENKKSNNNPKFPNSKLLEMANNSIQEILNQIFMIKCLYGISSESFKISTEEFSKNWNKILNKNSIVFSHNTLEIWNYEAQIISHIIYVIINIIMENFSIGNAITIDKVADNILISNIDNSDEILKFIFDNKEEINVANINLHFLKLLLKKFCYELRSKDETIFIVKVEG